MRKKSFRLLSVLLSVFLIVTMIPTVVFAGDTDPIEITEQPQSISGQAGEEKTMSVVATNATSYIWQRKTSTTDWKSISTDNGNYSGARTSVLSIKISKTVATDYLYRCLVKNSKYTVESETATVTLLQGTVTITSQPQSISGQSGEEKTMSVTATNATAYQWQRKDNNDANGEWKSMSDGNANYSGTKTASLKIKISKTTAGFSYRCIAKNSSSSATSDVATVTMLASLAITTQPKNVSGVAGDEKTMSVVATGATSYQWQRKDNNDANGEWKSMSDGNANYSGTKTASLKIKISNTTAGFSYRCVVKNSTGSVTSEVATVTVVKPLAITAQPKNLSGEVGTTVYMSVGSTGATGFRWQRSTDGITWTNISTSVILNYGGVTTETLHIRLSNTTAKYLYRCRITNGESTIESNAASVTIVKPFDIVTQPQNVPCYMGDQITMSVEANGATSYQWQRRILLSSTWKTIGTTNSNYTGAKTNTLGINVNKNTMLYEYRCVVSNGDNSIESEAASCDIVIVTYNGNGGLVVKPDKTTAETYAACPARGEEICTNAASPIAAERDGYDFVGWYFDPDGITRVVNYTPEKSVTLYAKWSRIVKVKTTFDANGGTFTNGSSVIESTVNLNGYVEFWQINTVNRPGYTFDGWFVDAGCTTRVNTSDYIALEDCTFYAGWVEGSSGDVTVTWHNNWNGRSVSYSHHKYQHLYYYNRTGDFTRDGYIFDGWFYDTACTERVNFSTFVLTSDITFYAGWVPDTYVTITWDCNGGYFYDDPNIDMNQVYEEHVALNGQVTRNRPALRTGYVFGGWYLDETCTNPKPTNMKATQNTTLYAKWTKAVTLYWDCVFGYMEDVYGNPHRIVSETVSQNSYFTLPYKIPERYGNTFTFTGWEYIRNGKHYTITSETNFATDTDVWFTAQWEQSDRVTLSFNANGGNVQVTDDIYMPTYNMEVEKSLYRIGNDIKAVRDGYFFAGWYLDADGIEPAKYHLVTQRMTVYAKWIEGERTYVVFNGNGGKIVSGGDQLFDNYGYDIAKDSVIQYAPPAEREGYSFAGWFTDAECTKPAFFRIYPVNEYGTVYFYAKWIRGEVVTITWESNSGLAYFNNYLTMTEYVQYVEKGKPLTEIPALSRLYLGLGTKYEFGGWYFDKDCTDPVNLDTFVANSNVKIYAKWNIVSTDG